MTRRSFGNQNGDGVFLKRTTKKYRLMSDITTNNTHHGSSSDLDTSFESIQTTTTVASSTIESEFMTSKSIISNCSSSDKSSSSRSNKHMKTSDNSGVSEGVLQWDDVLCRPIYVTSSSLTSHLNSNNIDNHAMMISADATSSVTNNDSDDEGEDNSVVSTYSDKAIPEELFGSSTLSAYNRTSTRRKATVTYGGHTRARRRQGLDEHEDKSFILNYDDAMFLDEVINNEMKHNRDTGNTNPKHMSPSFSSVVSNVDVNDEKFTEESSKMAAFRGNDWKDDASMTLDDDTYRTSICCSLDSDGEDDFVKQMEVDKENIDPSPKQRKSKRLSKATRKQNKKGLSNRIEPRTEDFEYFSDTEGKKITCKAVSQPSFNTDLSAAKAYFDQLDSNHILKVSSKLVSPKVSYPCVRTIRKVDYKCPQLLQEYEEYCKRSKECNFSPLPLKSYTSWRNQNIFPVGGYSKEMRICDGMLDDQI